jgi:hypothetical protein
MPSMALHWAMSDPHMPVSKRKQHSYIVFHLLFEMQS